MKFLRIFNILVIGLCGAIANPVEESPERFIVGGHEASIEDHPWIVSVQWEFTHQCGGTILGEKWVLTAAHCLDLLEADELILRVGSIRHKRGGDYYNIVKRAIKHPLYKNFDYNYYSYDFVLLELTYPLELTDKIQPIKLPKEDFHVPVGAMCEVTGWGRTMNPRESTDLLRAVSVPIVNQQYCKEQYEDLVEIKRQHLCAGYRAGGKDACNRDFGGPLTYETEDGTYLVGVMSFNENCAEPNRPSVYGRVTRIIEWIEFITGISVE